VRVRITLDGLARFLWAAALLTLPVTSFRYFPLGEDAVVRPLSLYPLALLLPLLLIRLARRKIRSPWPGALILLGAFLLVSLAVTIFGCLYAPPALRDQFYWGRAVRAWATVAIGLFFFVSAIWMNQDEDDLRFSLRWLLAGLCLNLLWSGVQALAFYTPLLDKHLVTVWQKAFSTRPLIKTERVSGLSFEPAWLAGQLAAVYLPWLFASLLTRYRLSRYKWLEPALLALTIVLLLMTFSRGGILIAAAAAALTSLLVGRAALARLWRWFVSGFGRRAGPLALRLGVLAMIAAALAGAVLFLGQKKYVVSLFTTKAANLEEFVIANYAGARVAYAWGAMGAFQEHPWTGVGLGASGFYIYRHLPDWALTTVPEIAKHLSPESRLYPNPKNLYVRLLAETGLLGFTLFGIFQLSLLGEVRLALRRDSEALRFLGAAALFSWLAVVLYSFTQDSFANPSLWVNLGILAGLSGLWSNHPRSKEKS